MEHDVIVGGVGINYREQPDIFAKRPEDEDAEGMTEEELEQLKEDLEGEDEEQKKD
jgi:hypothetical protein